MNFQICYDYEDFEGQERVFSKQLFWTTPFWGQGHTDSRVHCRWW